MLWFDWDFPIHDLLWFNFEKILISKFFFTSFGGRKQMEKEEERKERGGGVLLLAVCGLKLGWEWCSRNLVTFSYRNFLFHIAKSFICIGGILLLLLLSKQYSFILSEIGRKLGRNLNCVCSWSVGNAIQKTYFQSQILHIICPSPPQILIQDNNLPIPTPNEVGPHGKMLGGIV